MACDGPGVRQLTLAGTGRLPDKNSKGMRNRGIHKHAADKQGSPLVRGSQSPSTTLSQSPPEPKKAAALQPPDQPSRDTLDRFPFCGNRNQSRSLRWTSAARARESVANTDGPGRKRRGSSSCPISRGPSDALSSSTVIPQS